MNDALGQWILFEQVAPPMISAKGLLASLVIIAACVIGGDFGEQFTFNELTGCEATGQVGFLGGALGGAMVGAYIIVTRLLSRTSHAK